MTDENFSFSQLFKLVTTNSTTATGINITLTPYTTSSMDLTSTNVPTISFPIEFTLGTEVDKVEQRAEIDVDITDQVEGRFFTSTYNFGYKPDEGEEVTLKANGKSYKAVVESVTGENIVLLTEWEEV